jgi:hypothetical protein
VTLRALAFLAVLVPVACAAMARQDPQPLVPTERPTLAFTVWPATDAEGSPGRGYHAVAVFVLAMETAQGRFAFYRVSVLGLKGDVLINVPTDLAADAQMRALRNQADDAARHLLVRARLSCDSVRPRQPAETFGYRCA